MLFNDPLIVISCYAIGINISAFMAFAWDKHCAQNGMWRVRESTLLWLAAAGGTPGVIVGQRVLRHKTKKEPFRTSLLLICVIQIIVLLAICFPEVRNVFWAWFQQTFGQNV